MQAYDVVIVGARCAGATLATFLARSGALVLVVDKDRLPSDQPISTHTIHPPGMDVLDELGVGDEVRRLSPASRVVRLQKNDTAADLTYPDGRAEYCPRRERLDHAIQNAAMQAGVEMLQRTRVTALVYENDRVAGVRATRDGREHEYRAQLVVGADGRHSTIAALTGAPEYLGYDAPRGTYWGYWDAPDVWHDTARYPFDMFVGNRHGAVRVIFQTDHNQLLIASAPPLAECLSWRQDPLTALTADLGSDPLIAPLVEHGPPREKIRGTVSERYFFRQGAGPGWMLVGDAGHHKDYVIGDGITEALLQARSAAAAIAQGTDQTLRTWWRSRDVHALPLYYFAEDEGRPVAPLQLQCLAFAGVRKDDDLQHRLIEVIEHKRSPYDVFTLPQVLKWTMGALLRGKLGVVLEFLAMGKRASGVQREMQHRQRLLEESV